MTYFIDRRPNAKHKSAVNRQRFLERYRKHIKRSVEEAVNRRSITDMERGRRFLFRQKISLSRYFNTARAGRETLYLQVIRSLSRVIKSADLAVRAAVGQARGRL